MDKKKDVTKQNKKKERKTMKLDAWHEVTEDDSTQLLLPDRYKLILAWAHNERRYSLCKRVILFGQDCYKEEGTGNLLLDGIDRWAYLDDLVQYPEEPSPEPASVKYNNILMNAVNDLLVSNKGELEL